MKRKEYKDKYFAMFSTRIGDIVGKCSGEGIEDIPEEDIPTTRLIELTEEEFEEDELNNEELLRRFQPMYEIKVKTKLILEEI